MAKIDSRNRRQIISVMIILGIAVLGLIMVTMQKSGEHQSLYAGMVGGGATPDSLAGASATGVGGTLGKAEAAVSILKMLLALAVVIVCIYAGIYLLKRMTGKRQTGRSGSSLLEVLETAYIDPKKSLSLVRVADKSVLIGVTDNQISVLTELDQEHTQTLLAAAAQQVRSESFGNLLKSASDKLKGFGFRKDPQQ